MKPKPSWDVLLNFLRKHYIDKNGAGDYDIAIRDCLTDLFHIVKKVSPRTKLHRRLRDAEEVFVEETHIQDYTDYSETQKKYYSEKKHQF